MRVSQLIHAMDKDDEIVIDDFDAPIDNMTIYKGTVRGIKRDDPVNQMHVSSICAKNDTILVLAEKSERKAVSDMTKLIISLDVKDGADVDALKIAVAKAFAVVDGVENTTIEDSIGKIIPVFTGESLARAVRRSETGAVNA
ncbi:MAG: hypothetical protein J6S14_04975 [Clostridia bacterium]|nr:hypothetical protein [Clostridia bacterium]